GPRPHVADPAAAPGRPGPSRSHRRGVSAPSDNGSARATDMLSVEALTCSFGGVMAVSRVSFSVQRGELFGLIWPNGAGKTTLFNLITCLSAPTAGRLRHQGRDLAGLRPHR